MDNPAVSIFSAQKRPFLIVLLLAIMVNIAGIGVKFFTDDPALYSLIARNIARSNNFANLIYNGRDWLDKPHFPFWMAAISFKLFGENTIAYKLPALLFFFMSVIYTYKLARKFYGVDTALIAILILLTAQHVVMSNTDVRAEPYIMGLLMGSVYHFYKVKERLSLIDLLLGSLFAACAVMTKGIYLTIPIGAAIIGDYVFQRDYKGLFQWRWPFAVMLTALFTFPELYTLYTQFDLHPEKGVFGQTGVSGIHWFLWDSQFGRFSNEGPIRNTHGSIFFFMHTLLWAFAPWAIVFFYALFKNVRNIIKGISQPEYVGISASLLMLIIFSISKFQLPFYTNILFPFFAIITAIFINRLVSGAELKFFRLTQYVICVLLVLVIISLNIVFAPEKWWVGITLLMLLGIIVIYTHRQKIAVYQPVFLLTCAVAVFVNFYFVLVVYPTLLSYKGDVQAAEYINENYPGRPVAATFISNPFEFYVQQPVVHFPNEVLKQDVSKSVILFDQSAMDAFSRSGVKMTIIKTFDNYPKENFILPFIIKSSRASVLERYYLVSFK